MEDEGWPLFKAARSAIVALVCLFAALLLLQSVVDSNFVEKVMLAFLIVGIPVWCLAVLYTTFWPCPSCGKCFATGFVFIFLSNIPFRNSCIHCGYEPGTGTQREDSS